MEPLSPSLLAQLGSNQLFFSPKIAALGFRKTADVFKKKSLQFFFMPRFLNLHVSNANAASWWDVALSISQFEMVLFLMPFNDKDFCLQKMSSISPFETFYLFSWIFIWWLQIFCKSPLMCFMEVQKLQEDFFLYSLIQSNPADQFTAHFMCNFHAKNPSIVNYLKWRFLCKDIPLRERKHEFLIINLWPCWSCSEDAFSSVWPCKRLT